MTTALPARARRRWWRVGQPAAVVLGTLAVAAVLTGPSLLPEQARSATPKIGAAAAELPVSSLPGQGSRKDAPSQVGPGMPAADARVIRMHVGGLERGYLLLPALGLPPTEPAALVVVLHQDVGSARAVAEGLGLDSLRRQGVALAYPAGIGGSWNSGACCGVARDQGVDDVAFLDAVLDDVGRQVRIDPTRRAVLGYSGGGMMVYRLLCRAHPPLVAAVEVNGSLESHCPSGVELPDLLAVHGALDGTVGLTQPIRVTHLGMAPRPVKSTMSVVIGQAGCRGRTSRHEEGLDEVRWPSCRGGSSVDLQIVAGAGHRWEDVGGAERAVEFLAARLTRS